MECIRYINFINDYRSLQIDIKDIDESIFDRYMKWFHNADKYQNYDGLTISPKYVVKGDRTYIDRYIQPFDLVEYIDHDHNHDDKIIYHEAILILGHETLKLAKHWQEHIEYKSFVMVSFNLDKLINEATIKSIIE